MAFDPKPFFNSLRQGLMGPTLDQDEVDGCNAILEAMADAPIAWCAYALATAWHETAAMMQPVREAFWLSEAWRREHLRYWPWYGRGYVQLTWEENYRRADEELNLGGRLLENPELALDQPTAAAILRRGMQEGWFAGDRHGRHNFERHLPDDHDANQDEFISARRIINGTDKALMIARHALQFQTALNAGDW